MKDKFVGKYMRLARQIASDNNPCLSRKVGVIVVDPQTKGIVGAGYNGPPEGTPHCNEIEFLENFVWPQLTEEEKALMGSTKKEEAASIWLRKTSVRAIFWGTSVAKRSELCSCQHAERNALNKLPIPANGLIYVLLVRGSLHTVYRINYKRWYQGDPLPEGHSRLPAGG